jgi:hypothetical protein
MKMNKKQIKIALGILLFVVVIAGLYGIYAWRMAKIKEMLSGAELINGLLPEAVSYNGDEYLIPPSNIYDAGVELPAISSPEFDSVSEADSYLADDVAGIDIENNGAHRFYSYQILNWHEVVNDVFGVEPLIITHCSLCKSSAVYSSLIDGEIIEFKNAGKVYNNNQLIESDDGSLYLQLSGKKVVGNSVGQDLVQYPFEVMTWSEWKERYPNGEVLSSNTGYIRDYGMHPYQNYDIAQIIYYPLNNETKYMNAKWDIEGLAINNDAVAFADMVMKGKYVANMTVDGNPIVGFWHEDMDKTFVFSSKVNDQTLTFSFNSNTQKMTDDQTGSAWNSAGMAISGALSGTYLQPIQTKPSFWMCWYAQYPQTQIAYIDINEKTSSDAEDESTTIEIDGTEQE